jgi:hypothetical protein
MGGACRRYGEMKGADSVLVGKPEGRRPLGDLGADRRIILKWIFKKWDWGMDWIGLAQNMDR